ATTGKSMLDGTIPTTTYTIDTASGKLATERTPEKYRKEISCGEYHTILTYVDKYNPRGAEPTSPEDDPYYTTWESSVQAYITKHNANLAENETAIETCSEIPTEEDDVHTKDNEPDIRIKTPNNNDEVDRSFDVEVDIETRRDFSRIEYFIDDTLITTSENDRESSITLPSWVDEGSHTLTATVYDDVDNKNSDQVSIQVAEEGEETTFRITNPFSNQTIEKTASSYDVIVEVPDVDGITYLEVIAYNLWTGTTTVVGSTLSPSSITTLSWTLPDEAEYLLTARASASSGSTLESAGITVKIENTTPAPIIAPVSEILPL
ncbi:MAG: Repeat-containing protein, partial [Candidatus Uhrbacteria bacterium GW2011_GWD2_52_7]